MNYGNELIESFEALLENNSDLRGSKVMLSDALSMVEIKEVELKVKYGEIVVRYKTSPVIGQRTKNLKKFKLIKLSD
jgi:hypothetical protein